VEPNWGQRFIYHDVPTIKMANHAENGQIMWKISDNDDDNDYIIINFVSSPHFQTNPH
jgi:hypothetical protein